MRAVYSVFENKSPSLTDRLSLVKKAGQVSRCGDHDGPSYGVVLMHPGVPLENANEVWPRDFSSIVLCIPDVITRSTTDSGKSSEVYIHDRSHPSGEPVFLGAARLTKEDGKQAEIRFLDEVELSELSKFKYYRQSDVAAANRIWTVTVVDIEGHYDSNILFVTLGGAIILCASIALACWIRHNDLRNKRFNAMRSQADSEKAALILENARKATKTERELNDFIAHEVRNPVAAAMAACNFLKVEVNKVDPLPDEEAKEQAREDINIIDNSLKFVNDLLRNMLDMHRAANKQLQVTMAPTDLLHDILEPVGGMLYRRGSKVKLIVDCPENLWVMADRLRLKQVILNLGRNSSKFIEEGFIRLKAEEVDGNVRLFVDDSGSGIPMEKRERLFAKFQESLDLLSQGTVSILSSQVFRVISLLAYSDILISSFLLQGIGLHLCKSLVELMGGKIYLDDDFSSGIPGHPGTRFVVDLSAGSIEPPLALDTEEVAKTLEDISGGSGNTQGIDDDMNSIPNELPESLKILFVDDDSVLRKLFTRSIKTVCPNWQVRQAANGETALRLTEEEHFDVIFIDMYMASVEKQLLGTETVSHLRNNGITSRICGLSANDKEQDFYDAGADAFMFKPFPCDQYTMTQTLCRVLYQDHKSAYDGGYTDDF
jgi:signal transduction histidine kinase/CheY-like chemotaxis protein